MYNIQKAVSRLDYAPKLTEIQVTDIQKGLGIFTPKPDKPISFAALSDCVGMPARLTFIRKPEQTWPREIVIPGYGINRPLPK